MKNFKEIYENETNENTAFVLMLSEMSEKETQIVDLLRQINNKLGSIQYAMPKQNNPMPLYQTENGTVIKCFVTPEDYD